MRHANPSPRLKRILVIHGPNLNLLGSREPEKYGTDTLAMINRRLAGRARGAGATVVSFQSNHEGELIDRVQAAKADRTDAIIVNPAGLTQSSVALRDALTAVAVPFIEVHISNVHAREPFRRESYFSDVAVGSIVGLGSRGYDFALEYFLQG
jgi:3-dehydroquinate dehydratase-2